MSGYTVIAGMNLLLLYLPIGFVQSKHQIAKTNLIDAINGKCANARRASKAAAKSQ